MIECPNCGHVIIDHSGKSKRFAEFWDAFPKKQTKKESLELWKRKGLDGIADKIIAHVKARVTSPYEWNDMQYLPQPAKFLRRELWNDEIMVAAALPELSQEDQERQCEIDSLVAKRANAVAEIESIRRTIKALALWGEEKEEREMRITEIHHWIARVDKKIEELRYGRPKNMV